MAVGSGSMNLVNIGLPIPYVQPVTAQGKPAAIHRGTPLDGYPSIVGYQFEIGGWAWRCAGDYFAVTLVPLPASLNAKTA